MISKSIAGFLLAVAVTSGTASVRGDEQRIQTPRPGKQEVLSAEQKRRLTESAQRAFELRKAERPQLLNRLRALELKSEAADRQKLAAANEAVRAGLTQFQAPATDARYDAIEREARQLSQRAQTATAAEREVIDRRAAQLLLQLRGRRSPK